MEELTFKTIKVDAVNDTEKKVTLMQGKEKYNFWKKKQDGSLTKAYQQFQEFRVMAGNEYPIAVKEEEKTFRNDQGKDITFMDRSIMYFAFKEAGQGQVMFSQSQVEEFGRKGEQLEKEERETHINYEERFEKMLAWAKKMEEKVKNLEALVSTLTSKEAVDLHTSIPQKATVQQAAAELGGRVEGEWEFPKKN